MSILMNTANVQSMVEIQPHLTVDPVNLNNLHVLIQSILCGEGSDGNMHETAEQWRQRIEGYATELQVCIYGHSPTDTQTSEATLEQHHLNLIKAALPSLATAFKGMVTTHEASFNATEQDYDLTDREAAMQVVGDTNITQLMVLANYWENDLDEWADAILGLSQEEVAE